MGKERKGYSKTDLEATFMQDEREAYVQLPVSHGGGNCGISGRRAKNRIVIPRRSRCMAARITADVSI